ncbi:hypothetical protein KC717_00430 [Candidatus Dojkabacteria bacterium]|uniref:Uncharacterized protein n=1 Tax=Candidatus Dojkabacteria bacterium TaxID=2099670 RepID=A0A955RK77_9BACT|nr:hypothetical protein [Candidatus Dojkabacteria bacterium]
MFNSSSPPEGVPQTINPEKIAQDEANRKSEDTVMATVTAQFSEESLPIVEREFRMPYSELEGTEREYFGITVFFYDEPELRTANFRIETKFEVYGEMKAKILELITFLGGTVIS